MGPEEKVLPKREEFVSSQSQRNAKAALAHLRAATAFGQMPLGWDLQPALPFGVKNTQLVTPTHLLSRQPVFPEMQSKPFASEGELTSTKCANPWTSAFI